MDLLTDYSTLAYYIMTNPAGFSSEQADPQNLITQTGAHQSGGEVNPLVDVEDGAIQIRFPVVPPPSPPSSLPNHSPDPQTPANPNQSQVEFT